MINEPPKAGLHGHSLSLLQAQQRKGKKPSGSLDPSRFAQNRPDSGRSISERVESRVSRTHQ